uniref:Ribosomal protein L32 n=1 Tax=Neodangemannia microcystis TaxID=173495 RepID=A0A1W6EH94_9CHLO|nr:ribosomal protein L32 [Neodangemannia microcystis]ARK14778.1 ribosomal protein L32 [Neodangemannia microcystis]
MTPKKRKSKSKKNLRKTNWKNKASTQAEKALTIAKSVLAEFSETND